MGSQYIVPRCGFPVQTGRLEPAFRFAPYSSTPLLGQLERRPGLGPVPLGSFVYDPYNRGPLQTVGLNSDTVVDHIRFQVRSHGIWAGSHFPAFEGRHIVL